MYAIYFVADQTIMYLTALGEWTTKHKEAKLFTLEQDAINNAVIHNGLIEEVINEVEFITRPDTW